MLTPERSQFIGEIANDEWVDDFEASSAPKGAFAEKVWEIARLRREFLRETTDPVELHAFAERWNWDGGTEALRALVKNPACDRGTALMVYWLARPQFYLQFASRDEAPGWSEEIYDLIEDLEPRLVADDFATARIAFDPEEHGLVSEPPPEAKRALPPEVYVPTTG